MKYDEIDKKVQTEILTMLAQRRLMNANEDIGVAYMQAELQDRINPTLVITTSELKELTGRDKVRDVVLADYEAKLSVYGVVAKADAAAGTITVKTVPYPAKSTQFSSLRALKVQNEKDLKEDPSLLDDA